MSQQAGPVVMSLGMPHSAVDAVTHLKIQALPLLSGGWQAKLETSGNPWRSGNAKQISFRCRKTIQESIFLTKAIHYSCALLI